MRLIEQRLKVSGSAISSCEDHSFTKNIFQIEKKKKIMSPVLIMILPQAGNPVSVRISPSKLFLSR